MKNIELIPSLNLGSRTDQVVTVLTDLIMSGRLAPGDFLPSEPDLAKQLGVSRPTVRLALRTLETRGLVVTRHGVGGQVANRTREAATDSIELMLRQSGGGPRDMLEIRQMLECQGAALAARRATRDDIQAIAEAVDSMRDLELPIEEYVEYDLRFHLRLAEASRNDVLVALIHAIRGLLLDTIAVTYTIVELSESRLRDHERVLDAIVAGDSEGAEAAMRTHLVGTEDALRKLGLLQPRAATAG